MSKRRNVILQYEEVSAGVKILLSELLTARIQRIAVESTPNGSKVALSGLSLMDADLAEGFRDFRP